MVRLPERSYSAGAYKKVHGAVVRDVEATIDLFKRWKAQVVHLIHVIHL